MKKLVENLRKTFEKKEKKPVKVKTTCKNKEFCLWFWKQPVILNTTSKSKENEL